MSTELFLSEFDIHYHRNGISGEGFHVMTFKCHEVITKFKCHEVITNSFQGNSEDDSNMMAMVFEAPGHVAVFNMDKLKEGVIAFFENSYRGDMFESQLRKAIKEWS